MDELRRFNSDLGAKQALRVYLTNFIAEEAVNLLFSREDVSHIADAKDLIDKAFNNLEIIYAQQPADKPQTNEAR